MKTGTNVGLDKNYNNIAVGDQIKDKDGFIYTISQYGMAVRNDGGQTCKISELKEVELWAPPSIPSVEKEENKPAPEEDRQKLMRDALEILADADLAAELRARGYEVKATKTTIIEL